MDTRAKLHAWLLTIDEDLLAFEDALVLDKFDNPKRLHFFKGSDADNIGMAGSHKNMMLHAISILPQSAVWP